MTKRQLYDVADMVLANSTLMVIVLVVLALLTLAVMVFIFFAILSMRNKKKQIVSLKEQIKGVNNEKLQAENAAKNLREKLKEQSNAYLEASLRLRSFEEKEASVSSEKDKLTSLLSEAKEQSDKLAKQLQTTTLSFEKKIRGLQADVEKATEGNVCLTEENSYLKEYAESLQAECRQQKDQIDHLKKECTSYKKQLKQSEDVEASVKEKLAQQKEAYEMKLYDMQSQIEEITADNAQTQLLLEQEIKSCKEQLHKIDRELESTKEQLREKEYELNSIKKLDERYKWELENKQSKSDIHNKSQKESRGKGAVNKNVYQDEKTAGDGKKSKKQEKSQKRGVDGKDAEDSSDDEDSDKKDGKVKKEANKTEQSRKISAKESISIAKNIKAEPMIVMPSINSLHLALKKDSVLNAFSLAGESATQSKCVNRIEFPSASGILLLPNKMNLGRRRKRGTKPENVELEYVGTVTCGNYYIQHYDSENARYALAPRNGTRILGYQCYGGTTGGITEPLLYHALKEVFKYEPEIDVLQNISLPIRNRNYGYKPDIAVIWKRYGIYFDIEIDEPYDILTRRPIHYKGCADVLRNAYFIDSGWFVYRVPEINVVNNTVDVAKDIADSISQLVMDSRFVFDIDMEDIPCWTYEQAKAWAEENYRENYLGIDPVVPEEPRDEEPEPMDTDSSQVYCAPRNFVFVRPDSDILDDRYEDERSMIMEDASKAKYLKLKRIYDGYEFVTVKNSIKFCVEAYCYGIRFDDVVEDKSCFLGFCDLDSWQPMDELFRKPMSDDWEINIWDCIRQCNPIKMRYTSQSGERERKDFYLTPWYDWFYDDPEMKKYKEGACPLLLQVGCGWIHESVAQVERLTYFCAQDSYRNELRTFKVSRMQDVKIYDCFKPLYVYGVNYLWELLTKGYGKEVEDLYHHLSTALRKDPFVKGNYANALVMASYNDKAYEIYTGFPKEMRCDANHTWHDLCVTDINYFIEKEIYADEFSQMKSLLKEKSWW